MPDNLEVKSFGALEIKNEEKGEVAAVIATLGVVDKMGDVLLPGSFPEAATVKMSAYDHDIITTGAAPVGIGTVSVKGDKAIFSGRFFMTTTRGRDAFQTVKELGAFGEWSFGFPRSQIKTEKLTDEWKALGALRLVAGLVPVEASPVFEGAGVNTGTLFTKAKEPEPEPPDPAIEAARLQVELDVKAAAELNAKADRLFRRFQKEFRKVVR